MDRFEQMIGKEIRERGERAEGFGGRKETRERVTGMREKVGMCQSKDQDEMLLVR